MTERRRKKAALFAALSLGVFTFVSGCGNNAQESEAMDTAVLEEIPNTEGVQTEAKATEDVAGTEGTELKEVPGDTLPEDVAVDTTVTVSPLNASEMNGGKFEGWGTSLCWWANRLGYSDTLAQQSADLFFGEDGLRLNIMRYNIGGGDDPDHKHITRTDSAVPGWMVWDEDAQKFVYDYSADKNQLNVLERAVKAAGDDAIVEVFSNSPPYFMTVSGCSSGGKDPNVTNLKEDSFGEFAEYLAHVTNYIQNDMGIRVASVSPMNEPDTNFWSANSNKQEGCHVDSGADQSRIIELTAEALKKYDLGNVIVAASDETSTAKQIDEYRAYSEQARSVIGRINTHTYDSSRIAELGNLAKKEGFNLWMSEVDGSGTAGNDAGEMGSALWLGEKIISDINALSPSAWVMWQIIDNHISAKGYNGRKDKGMVDVNKGFWGGAVADHDKETIVLTQKYYGFGQFTRYIRPGMTIIHCGGEALAAIDREKGELVVVALNKSASDRIARFDLSQFKSVGSDIQAVRTSGNSADGEHWAAFGAFRAEQKCFVAELKANSISTFIIRGVEMGSVSLQPVSLQGAVVTGSVPWQNGPDTADHVIDGSTETFFDGVEDGWLEIDFGEEKEFDVIGYAPRNGFEGRMKEGSFYGSNDGESWTKLYTVTAAPASGLNYAFLDGSCRFRYLRYDVPDGRPEGAYEDYLCNIAEIELYHAGE